MADLVYSGHPAAAGRRLPRRRLSRTAAARSNPL